MSKIDCNVNSIHTRSRRWGGAVKAFFIWIAFFALAGAADARVRFIGDFSCFEREVGIAITGYTGTETHLAIPDALDGKPVTSIGGFRGSSLVSVTIPDSVTSISRWAFWDCSDLVSLTIGAGVTSMGRDVFPGCVSLEEFVVAEDNPEYSSLDGVLFNKDRTKLLRYPQGRIGEYVIPGSVTSIGDGAFSSSTKLAGVTIPESVTSIGGRAFSGCTGLTSVTIPDGVTRMIVGIFQGTNLVSVKIGAGVVSFSRRSLARCNSLEEILVAEDNPSYSSLDGVLFNKDATELVLYPQGRAGDYTIPDSVTNIRDGAFSGSTRLTSVNIGAGVTSIGKRVFAGCIKLKEILADQNNPAYSSLDGVLLNRDGSMLVMYPLGRQGDYSIPDTIISIGGKAFSRCTNLTSVTIPEGVAIIGESAFANCSNLTSVTIPDSVTSIGERAFARTGLINMTIPDSVTSIGNYAFRDCSSLTSVTIGAGVTSIIKESVFVGCRNLKEILVNENNPEYSSMDGVLFNKERTKLLQYLRGRTGEYTIPDSVTSIEDAAFANCSNLTSVTIPDSVTSIGYRAFAQTGLTSVTIPDSVTSIEDRAFAQTGLTSVTIPDSVTGIGDSAFANCSNLTSVTIPESITSIGDHMFSGCSSLTSVTIPASVTSIGEGAFASTGLTSVRMPGSITSIGDRAFQRSRLRNIEIPDGVKSIGKGAFIYCLGLRSVQIPDSVTCIGERAFAGAALASVTIGAGVTSIGEGAFSICHNLKEILVDDNNPEFSSLDGVLFNKNKTKLLRYPQTRTGEYAIPGNVISIGNYAFSGCTELTSVTMPDNLTSIGEGTFWGCSGLTSLLIPDKVTSIGDSAFKGCTRLASMKIPDSVTSIGDLAFWDCSSLTSVTIGAGVTRIGDRAFLKCISLEAVYFHGNAPGYGENVFEGTQNVVVYFRPETTGWEDEFAGRPTAVWRP